MSKNLLISLSVILLTASACGTEAPTEEKISRDSSAPLKTVETIEIGKNYKQIYLEKSGFSKAAEVVRVTPEVMGKVTGIKVEVGQIVKEGATLITLGDSLGTDLNETNLQTLKQQSNLNQANQQVTDYLGQQAMDAAQIGVSSAYQGYENALLAKENQVPLFEEQYQSSLLEIDNAHLGYETARQSLEDLEDSLENTEDELNDIEDEIFTTNDPAKVAALEQTKEQLEGTIDTLESQINSAELSVELAENRIVQSEIALEQVISNYRSQFSQLNAAIETALTQYNSAINQFETAQGSTALQKIAAGSQSLQTQSAENSAKITAKYQNISAPISGKVTEINVEEGNLVTAGQILVKIENDEMLTIKASVNTTEARFIPVGGIVEVMVGQIPVPGKVKNISPTLDEFTKKVDLEIEVQKPKGLATGELVKLRFPIDSTRSIFIPLNSIFAKEDQKLVRLVMEDGKVKHQPVITGEIIGNHIEIIQGLEMGDKVITSINTFIEDGEKVEVK